MSKNILKKGFPLGVYNRTKKKTEELKKLDAKVFDSPQELAKHSDVVITMITGPKDVKEVYLGRESVVKGAKKGLIAIDMSTIGVQTAQFVHKSLKKYNIDFLDAPVTGSVPKAVTGGLTIFIGGDKKIYQKVKDIFSAMGTNLHYMGPSGTGQAMKLINNQLIATSLAGLAESMLLADVLHLSRQKVADVLATVPAISPFMKMKLSNMVSEDYTTAFSMSNMRKDLRLALREAKKKRMPVLKLVESLFTKGVDDENLGEKDNSAILHVLKNL